jgi:acetyl-CoA carboxylase carboxyl transferase subunit beta
LSWFKNIVPPGLKKIFKRREVPDNLWLKCPECDSMIFHKDAKESLFVCPECDHHLKVTAEVRFEQLLDEGSIDYIDCPDVPIDRLKETREKTKKKDSILIGSGFLNANPVVMAVHDFSFMGGSLGMAAGESIVLAIEESLKKKCPFILCAASGGARMQEGILSLMQMPRVTVMLQALREEKLPYIVILTNPTTGGVTASYAMLGDIHIAEPKALIGFAGPRVIESTINENLPEGFQKSEYLLDHGMVDMVVHRKDLRKKVSNIIDILVNKNNNIRP